MRQSRIDYGRLVEGALRGVVRDVLTRVSREGLPSPHHFYVTFRSEYPGVVMPEFLRERYPAYADYCERTRYRLVPFLY